MVIHNSWQPAIQSCLDTKSFAVARLYCDEKNMDIRIHDCYVVYYAVSGGKQFLIDDRVYSVEPGDLFFVNQFESHCLAPDDENPSVRVGISIYPDYLKRACTEQTDLNYCFTYHNSPSGHKISLNEEERKRFMFFIHKLSEEHDFGQDVLDQAVFLELMTYLNRAFRSRCALEADSAEEERHSERKPRHAKVDEILDYINQHLGEDLSVPVLATQFYLSSSYLHKIFKDATGTTVNRYITSKRISRAKVLLTQGHSVAETASQCGFHDYSNFLKSFTKTVGISPKKYAAFTQS